MAEGSRKRTPRKVEVVAAPEPPVDVLARPSAAEPPEYLGVEGAALWRRLFGKYRFGPHEAELVLVACRIRDRISAMQGEIDRHAERTGSLMTVNVRGEIVNHPATVELRLLEQRLGQVFASLRLPDDPGDEDAGEAPAAEAGRPQHRGGARGAYKPRAFGG